MTKNERSFELAPVYHPLNDLIPELNGMEVAIGRGRQHEGTGSCPAADLADRG
jgi:hypothetical protein